MPSPILAGFRNVVNGLGMLWGGGSMYPAVSQDTERSRPNHPDMARDVADLLPQPRFKQAVSDARWLVVASDIVGGAIRQKTDYVSASHFATHYCGSDEDWGELADEACQQLDALCCTRGERYDWKRMWGLTVTHRATDGGVFFNLTETETGWPMVQPIESVRVGCRDDSQVVKSGSASSYKRGESGQLQKISTPYTGLKIMAGIIYDEGGREVAFRVLGGAEDGSQDVDISAQDMVYIATPRWFSEGRPLPEIAVSALSLQDIHLARQAQLTKHIHSARQIGIQENETGTPTAARRLADPLATRTPNGTGTTLVEEGNFTFVKRGDKVTPWDTKTPGGEWMAYDDKIVASALHALGWRIEMLDPSGMKGANTRAFADQINTTIMEYFDSIAPAILRVRRWQIAKLIQRGDLPASSDWWKWGVTPPPEFSSDPGRAIQSELEAVRAGAQSMPHLIRRWGMRSRGVLHEQAKYLIERREVAEEYELTPEEAMQLGTLAKPGDAPPPDGQQEEQEKKDAEEKAGEESKQAAAMAAQVGAISSEIAALGAKIDAPKPIVIDAALDQLRITVKTDQTIDALCEEIKAKHAST